MTQSSRFPGETAEQIAKRAEIAYDKAIKLTNEAEASSGTTMICVVECRKMLGKAWTRAWVDTRMKAIGFDHASDLIRLYDKSPEEQKAWWEKKAASWRVATECNKAPRQDGDNLARLSPTLALPDIVLTKAEKARIKKARQRAKAREERVAAGADIPPEPLAPIEHRRLLNELKGLLSGFDFADLRKVKAFIERDIFRS